MNFRLPTITSYGKYSSDNYGAHTLRVEVGPLTVWFSYQTPVAFEINGKRVIRQNDWNTTTGKHLNWIDGGSKEAKKNRVTSQHFEELWREMVEVQDAQSLSARIDSFLNKAMADASK